MNKNTKAMKRMIMALLAATLVVGTSLLTACSANDDNHGSPVLSIESKMIGKWMVTDLNGRPALTNEKAVITFVSTSKAIVSSSKADFTETEAKWHACREHDVKVEGNKISAFSQLSPTDRLLHEYDVVSITDTEMTCKVKITGLRNGEVVGGVTEDNVRMVKIHADYSDAILGVWQGVASNQPDHYGNVERQRWAFKADGTHAFSLQNAKGEWAPFEDEFAEYFVDGILFCARWKNTGDGAVEQREWWEIESIRDGVMKWTALRQREDGTTYTDFFTMTKVE